MAELEERVGELELALEDARAETEMVGEDLQFHEQLAQQQSRVKLSGFVDLGFFRVGGDGSGLRSDIGNFVFPEFTGSWVFMGDPLSTAINARGEPADTGESRAVTFDPVDAGDNASFILNTLSVSLFAGLTEELQVNAQIDFVPRDRDVRADAGPGAESRTPGIDSLGDFIDVELAYAEWRPYIEGVQLSFFAGKFDSVLGVEYRSQDAPSRVEVTPSLICRYTCGRPIGLKARAGFFEGALVVNLSATNGSHFVDYFPFTSETDMNDAKTGAGRVSYELPIGPGIEVGISGAVGAQDLQPENGLIQWHVGADVLVQWDDLLIAAEFVRGEAPGASEDGIPCRAAQCLEYQGAYGRVGYRFVSWLLPYVRVDWRDALHRQARSFVYVSDLVRFTGGVRFEFGPHVVVKAEYTHNRELGPIPQFDNDIFTSALVVRY